MLTAALPSRAGVGTSAGAAPDAERFRPDLEGLRALAVVLVLLFHAEVPGFPGGYVGVDVFFVLSGFFITGLLLRELRATRSVALLPFYARRARRLLPAASAAILATVLLAFLFLPAILVRQIAVDGLASALYVANIHFGLQATNYFQDALNPSPLLHMWSLGVEEQFYLAWPAILLVVGRGGWNPRRIALTIGIVGGVSFVASAWLTTVAAPWAFYSLPTRAWQLALGGAIALAAIAGIGVRGRVGAILAAAGVLSIVVGAVIFTTETPFPGLAAVLPAGGAALVIAAGLSDQSARVLRVLSLAPVRWVGRISYSLYLWHWPLIVLPAEGLQVPLPLPVKVGLALATFPVAAASYHWIEQPIRRGAVVGLAPRRALALLVGVAVAVGGLSFGLSRLSPRGGIVDAPLIYEDGCNVAEADRITSATCLYGDLGSQTSIALFGDSRAAQWFPALERLAEANGWRLLSLTKNACPFVEVTVWDRDWLRPHLPCDAWRESMMGRLAAEAPDIIVVASGSNYSVVEDGRPLAIVDSSPAWDAALPRTLGRLAGLAGSVVVLGVTPTSRIEPPVCLAVHRDTPDDCATSRPDALDPARLQAEGAAAAASGAVFIDPTAWVCPADPCPVVIDGRPVYRDQRHLSAAFVLSLAERLAAELPLVPAAAR
jgi:peptidoglycan/LPS O-acetylase OafA/YrhL